MFQILKKSFSTGVVTSQYPAMAAEVSSAARGEPDLSAATVDDARLGAAACPTGALTFEPSAPNPKATLSLDKCLFCGLCAEAGPSIRMTNRCELAAFRKEDLQKTVFPGARKTAPSSVFSAAEEAVGQRLHSEIHRLFGRSLHIREVDAGSCNGCEIEIGGLNSPVYDIERFGIHFVASPRHADMLLVTGPVTRNMELALRKTHQAMPGPGLVVAVGACGCSGGLFGKNYASLGGVDSVLPVDVFIPGCPPNPFALLHGILLAIGRVKPSA
jgi:Ni,Fe-hydrogenase III small subunit/formate hydrogenlyase subunit 6/NADH:ubiquinone oxidoreductase subunit I